MPKDENMRRVVGESRSYPLTDRSPTLSPVWLRLGGARFQRVLLNLPSGFLNLPSGFRTALIESRLSRIRLDSVRHLDEATLRDIGISKIIVWW
jgi:hypothetical protein